MRIIPKLVVVLLACAGLGAPVQAQVAPEAKRAIRAAMAICIDWARGKTDYSKTPPPGFAAATGVETLSFNLVAGMMAGVDGKKPKVFWAEPNASFNVRALRIGYVDNSCVVIMPAVIRPPTLKELVDDVDAAAISHAKEKILLGYSDSLVEAGSIIRFFESGDERRSMLMYVMHGWQDGKPAPSLFAVGLSLQ